MRVNLQSSHNRQYSREHQGQSTRDHGITTACIWYACSWYHHSMYLATNVLCARTYGTGVPGLHLLSNLEYCLGQKLINSTSNCVKNEEPSVYAGWTWSARSSKDDDDVVEEALSIVFTPAIAEMANNAKMPSRCTAGVRFLPPTPPPLPPPPRPPPPPPPPPSTAAAPAAAALVSSGSSSVGHPSTRFIMHPPWLLSWSSSLVYLWGVGVSPYLHWAAALLNFSAMVSVVGCVCFIGLVSFVWYV